MFTSYWDIFSNIVAYLELGFSEPCYIQNPGIFSTQEIFRTLSRHILANSERCVTLAFENPAIFRILAYLVHEAYSESCLFSYIQAYSEISSNDSYNNINFLFFRFNLTYFSTNSLTTMTSVSMLD